MPIQNRYQTLTSQDHKRLDPTVASRHPGMPASGIFRFSFRTMNPTNTALAIPFLDGMLEGTTRGKNKKAHAPRVAHVT